VPLYEDLVRRALQAHTHAAALRTDSRRIRDLAVLLREAHAHHRLLRHCAWCGRLEVGGEWLHLEAIGSGQQQIATSLIEGSTHGICPGCLQRALVEVEAERAARNPS
jgi:hypothetical protein